MRVDVLARVDRATRETDNLSVAPHRCTRIDAAYRELVTRGNQSAHGKATVYLQRVEIGGLAVSGYTLDFMIETFFLPLYPNAKINQPFELNDNVDRLEVRPGEALVFVKGRPATSSPTRPGSPSRSSGPAPARRS